MNINDLIPQLLVRCKEASGAEAVAWGLPNQLGKDIFDGTMADDLENWDKQQFMSWCKELDSKYPDISTDTITKFYVRVSELMKEYYDSMIAPTLK